MKEKPEDEVVFNSFSSLNDVLWKKICNLDFWWKFADKDRKKFEQLKTKDIKEWDIKEWRIGKNFLTLMSPAKMILLPCFQSRTTSEFENNDLVQGEEYWKDS